MPQVVIVGGGFGGLHTARGLAGAPVHVTLVDRTNHHLFQPLLYQVATAGLSPADVAAPIRSILARQRNCDVVMAEVLGVDTAAGTVITDGGDLPFDYLVLSTGSTYNYFGHDEWKDVAPSLKSVADATKIRERILVALEAAETEPDAEARRALMTVAIVGAGPTGVELAGAIVELTRFAMARDFRRITPADTRVILLDAGPRILAAFPEALAARAQSELERRGVDIRVSARVQEVDAGGVTASGVRIPSRTVIWAAGVAATPAAQWLGAPVDRSGRAMVGPDLSVPGLPCVYVIGDAAHAEHDGAPLPGIAPVAMQQGRHVAQAISARVAGQDGSRPFAYRDKGNLATVGRSFAIMEVGRIRLSGFLAWAAWLAVHIYYLIGFRNRLLVLTQWAWAYLTYQRGARLVASLTGSLKPRRD